VPHVHMSSDTDTTPVHPVCNNSPYRVAPPDIFGCGPIAIAKGISGRSNEVRGRNPGMASEAEAEAVCRHCIQIFTAETIRIWKFRTIHFLFLDQYVYGREL